MADEDFSGAKQPASYHTRITPVRDGCRDQFLILEMKVDAFILRNIDLRLRFFDREAWLKALEERVNLIQNLDAEIELTIENQEDLTKELDLSTEFQTAASIAIARLLAIIDD